MIPVVAVALIDGAQQILMQKRRAGGEHGALWEFPGGKVEPGESCESALIREMDEELGIDLKPGDTVPFGFSSDPTLPPAARSPVVILLYTCSRWTGEPRCLDGEAIAWFAPEALAGLAMPPLDVPLAARLVAALGSGLV